MWKTFLILMLLISSCNGTMPTMDKKVKVYNGSPEVGGICRGPNTMKKTKAIKNSDFVIDNKADSRECIDAYDDKFKAYGCMTFVDMAVLQKYTETLIKNCKKWKD